MMVYTCNLSYLRGGYQEAQLQDKSRQKASDILSHGPRSKLKTLYEKQLKAKKG
jgi:hypothetical protein